MKKFIINALLLVFTLSASAQSKQDLQNTINQQNQQIGELQATLKMKNEQLEQANKTIVELRQQLAGGAAAQKPATFRDSVAVVIEQFTSCSSWQEALKYVMEPERVRPIMQKYYAYNPFSLTMWTAEEILKDNGFSRINGKSHTIYTFINYYVVKTVEGYRIDWEASMVYNPVSLADLQDTPKKVITCRLEMISIDNDYSNNSWRRYVDINVPGGYLYTEKGTAVDKQLYELTKGGNYCDIIAKVYCEQENDGSFSYTISDIISTSLSIY